MGLIHATPIAIPPVRAAFADRWPEAGVLDLLDQRQHADAAPDGSLGPRATDRMLRVISLVRDADVGVIQLSCSAYSPLVPVLRQTASVPVLAIGAPIILAVGGGTAYWLWRRQHRETPGAAIDHGDWK